MVGKKIPIFLDRDGVINKFPGRGEYVTKKEELIILERSAEAIAKLNRAGFLVYVVSNQAGVGRGIFSEKDLMNVTEKLREELKRYDAKIDEIFYCTHHPDKGCNCRKPKTGMVDGILSKYPIKERKRFYFIGDSQVDVLLAKNVGVRAVLVLSGGTQYDEVDKWDVKPDMIYRDLLEFVEEELNL